MTRYLRRLPVLSTALMGLAVVTTFHVLHVPGLAVTDGGLAAGTAAILSALLLTRHGFGTGSSAPPPVLTSSTDPLTGLHNRQGLRAHIDDDHAPDTRLTLLAIDLDGLRRINEEAGHDTGDRIMIWLADHLSALAAPDGLAARIDGDDFVIVLPALDLPRAEALSRRLRGAIGASVDFEGQRFHLSLNVAIVAGDHHRSGPSGRSRAAQLLQCVDAALGDAQADPTGSSTHRAADCRRDAVSVLQAVDDLHAALAVDDQLTVHLQPQHGLHGHEGEVSTATLTGCEALLRWRHPTLGQLGPAPAIAAAAHGHLTRALTQRVLDLALAAAAQWWSVRPLPVAINLTTDDLDDPDLPQRISDALATHHLPSAALTVEVVEDSVMLDPERATRTLHAIQALGVEVAIDDYGTGYSSLAYLHRLPIDKVKFDRSLTTDLERNPAAVAILTHSIRLAHDLGLTVVAEGVELPYDLQQLRSLGCDAVQGYLTGRPQSVGEWLRLIESNDGSSS